MPKVIVPFAELRVPAGEPEAPSVLESTEKPSQVVEEFLASLSKERTRRLFVAEISTPKEYLQITHG